MYSAIIAVNSRYFPGRAEFVPLLTTACLVPYRALYTPPPISPPPPPIPPPPLLLLLASSLPPLCTCAAHVSRPTPSNFAGCFPSNAALFGRTVHTHLKILDKFFYGLVEALPVFTGVCQSVMLSVKEMHLILMVNFLKANVWYF